VDREQLHLALQEYGQLSAPALESAVLTRWVVLGEFLTPRDDLAFHRMSGSRDGRPLVSWEVDGLLITGLLRGRKDLNSM
jgi:hypothetical protein